MAQDRTADINMFKHKSFVVQAVASSASEHM